MERLTIKTPTGAALKLNSPQTEQEAREMLMAAYKVAVEKLADYEDAEEQGRIVALPEIKDATIYIIEEIKKPLQRWVTNRPVNFFDMTGLYVGFGLAQTYYNFADLGKEWFLTREEAESKLKFVSESDTERGAKNG